MEHKIDRWTYQYTYGNNKSYKCNCCGHDEYADINGYVVDDGVIVDIQDYKCPNCLEILANGVKIFEELPTEGIDWIYED